MGILDHFRRKKVDGEAERRRTLLSTGRITDGLIFDIVRDEETGAIHVFYNYTLNGVDYESSQTLDAAQLARQNDYYPGAHVTIRFNPHQPANSIVV
ncbi:MAG TPA: hypothetical protein VFX96_16060 [Pyrinomonadaceae bacterium]|nr:hypothetical protein [Pyrinomonadaceae bacterium]